MKNNCTFITRVVLTTLLSVVLGCGNNNPSSQSPETGRGTSPPGKSKYSDLSSPEEVLANAKKQVEELLAHPAKADAWLDTSLRAFNIQGSRFAKWVNSAQGAAHCAHKLVSEQEIVMKDPSKIYDVIKQTVNCVIDCRKAHWVFNPEGQDTMSETEKMRNDIMTKHFPEHAPAASTTTEIAKQLYDHLHPVSFFLGIVIKQMKADAEAYKLGGAQAIIVEAGRLLNAITCLSSPGEISLQYQKKIARDLTYIALLLVEAVKATYPNMTAMRSL